jgi:ParB family chromosome partitioning protein
MSVQLKPGVVALVPVSELQPDPYQPRKNFDPTDLRALGETMKQKVRHPLTVRIEGKKKIIFDGERRWRAAKLVKIDKLPCLLDGSDEDAVARAAGQIITSQQREGLSPIDIAEFLVDLRTREKKSTNELLAALAKRGIKDMGVVKMEAVMRLTELPKWIKERIDDGKLDASHGAAAIPVIDYPAVGKVLQEIVDGELDWKSEITAKEMAEHVVTAFEEVGHDLNGDHSDPKLVRQFDIKVCKGCEFYKKIGKVELCMNLPEFRKKNDQALKLKGGEGKKPPPKKLSAAEKRQLTKLQNQRSEQRDLGRKDRTRDHLDRWLRERIQKNIEQLVGETRDLSIWLALGAPNHPAWGGSIYCRHEEAARVAGGLLNTWKVATLPGVIGIAGKICSEPKYRNELNKAAVRVMTREELRWFARDHLQISLDGSLGNFGGFRIDADYLRLKRKGELLAMAKAAGVEKLEGGSVKAVTTALLEPEIVERIGVPADIVELYAEPLDFGKDDDDIGDDDEQGEPVCIECGCSEFDACEGGCAWVDMEQYPVKIGGAHFKRDDQYIPGLCSNCPTKRWNDGVRDFSEAAIARINAREAAAGADPAELAEMERQVAKDVEAHKPPGKKKAKGRKS